MNLRALALGAVIGFLFALSPSCGGKPDCDGCVDETGACVKARDVSANACGTGGAVCQACAAGATCQAGACVSPDGGPGASTCKEPCPDGCCDSSGACQTGRSNSACGSGAVTCAACGQGQACGQEGTTWQCTSAAVGTACTDNAQCQALLGQQGVCKKTTTRGPGVYPEGYCTVLCNDQSVQCPGGSTCVVGVDTFGEDDWFCWDNCNASATGGECRAGYACYRIDADNPAAGGCWLANPPDPSAPAGFSGKACTPDAGCGEPPYLSGCYEGQLPDGGPSFTGGYCIAAGCEAFGPDFCGADGVCVNYFADSQGNPIPVCMRSCANVPNTGASIPDGGCRDSYVCQPFGLSDGGLAPDGFCKPSCEVGGCGSTRTCATDGALKGYCLRPDGGL